MEYGEITIMMTFDAKDQIAFCSILIQDVNIFFYVILYVEQDLDFKKKKCMFCNFT